MRYAIFFFLLSNFLGSCNNNKSNRQVLTQNGKHLIAILPFIDVDKSLVQEIKNGIEKKLQVEITILGEQQLPATAFYKPRERFIADSILNFLQQKIIFTRLNLKK